MKLFKQKIPSYKKYLKWLKKDLAKGCGVSRKELFGKKEKKKITSSAEIVHNLIESECRYLYHVETEDPQERLRRIAFRLAEGTIVQEEIRGIRLHSNPNENNEDNEQNTGDYQETINHMLQPFRFRDDQFPTSERPFSIIRRSILDINYPHKCFSCKKELNFNDFLATELSGYPTTSFLFLTCFRTEKYQIYKHLKKLWRSPYVQLYCCNCYIKNK